MSRTGLSVGCYIPRHPARLRLRARASHVTLRLIANNAEIDVIWEQYQQTLEPLRERLNADSVGESWEEWEIPREAEDGWPAEARALHEQWWEQRTARQRAIDASIAAKAEFEYLYDKPYTDNRKVRVAGPFTVESLSPHRVLGLDEDDELIDGVAETPGTYGEPQDFGSTILAHLSTAGVQQAHKEDRIEFSSVTPWPGAMVCADGSLHRGRPERSNGTGAEKRAGIFIGPEFGTVSRPDLVEAAREAADAGFDVLIACAFNYEAHATDFNKLGRVPVLKARMNADLHMAGDLKNTGKGNLFVIFGEPDIDILDASGDDGAAPGQLTVKVNGVDVFHPNTGEVRSDGPDEHRLLVHRHRLQPGELLRPPRLLPRPERPVQGAQDHAQGRDQRGGVGDAAQRHLAPLRQAGVRAASP